MDTGVSLKRKRGRPAGKFSSNNSIHFDRTKDTAIHKKRTMSKEGRAKIAAAQKARSAKSRMLVKSPASNNSASVSAKKVRKPVARERVEAKKASEGRRTRRTKPEATALA
jgi:hypothetical protein